MSYTDIQLAGYAKNLREEIGLDQHTRIGNIREIVHKIGHKLEEDSFGDAFSAACFLIEIPTFGIVLNTDTMWNENFIRFTLAHELGHTYLTEHWAELQRQNGKLKTKAEFQSAKVIEREADKFAVHFLTPKNLFEDISSNKAFEKNSLKEICRELGISILTGAFRFVELTDLCCSLIIIDEDSQKIKYEFRSKLMRQVNHHEYINGYWIPYQGLVSRSLVKPLQSKIKDERVYLNEYYPRSQKRILCNESVLRLGYNSTTIVMLSALDDPEEFI